MLLVGKSTNIMCHSQELFNKLPEGKCLITIVSSPIDWTLRLGWYGLVVVAVVDKSS
jgi:hypothetical protein